MPLTNPVGSILFERLRRWKEEGKAATHRTTALLCGLFLAVVGSAGYLFNLDSPSGPYWDENYYLTATARYAQGLPQFASHPPLGLMLLAAGDRLTGVNHGVDLNGLAQVKTVSQAKIPPAYRIWSTRLASAVFGVAIILSFYLILLTMRFSPIAASAVALLLVFETAFIVQFRAAHLDAFQVEFALISIGFLMAVARRPPSMGRALLFAGAGLSAGAAMMVKLDGALIAAGAGVLLILSVGKQWRAIRTWVIAGLEGAAFALAMLVAIALVYGAQTLWCKRPLDYGSPAAAIDARFMSTTYQHYLDGRRAWSPAVVAAAAQDSFKFMLNDQAGVARTDPNGSSPWLQPLGVKSITYRWDAQGGATRYVQLVANPVNWALGAVGLLTATALLVAGRRAGKIALRPATARQLAPVVATALAFYFGHGLLGVHRVMYLYHAFLPQLLGLLCVPFIVRDLVLRRRAWRRPLEVGAWSIMLASAVAFLWFGPLAYHWPLSHQACDLRNVPVQIVACRP